jgi:glycine cleavage system transcriptional repressor
MEMKTYAVLTAVGPDRPGLVDQISEYMSDRKINIEDSRMAVLGGEFALILLAGGTPVVMEQLLSSTDALEKKTGLIFNVKRTQAPGEKAKSPSLIYRLHGTSMDHPGIVREITRVLLSHGINIESMETRVQPAPLSGTPIFSMDCVLAVPVSVKIANLREELYDLGDDLNVDISFEPAD